MSAGVLQPLVSVCCSLICPWINYCNGILYSTPNDTIKLQGVQMYSGSFFECQDNAMPNRWYTAYTGGAKDNVQAVSDHTSTPVYLSHHLQTHSYTRDLQSSDTPLLSLPCYMTCTSCQWSHLNTSLPQSSLTDSQLHTRPSVIWHSTAESTLLHDCFWWPWFLPFNNSTSCVWNSLPRTVLDSQSLSVVKTKLKTHLFHLVHNNGE